MICKTIFLFLVPVVATTTSATKSTSTTTTARSLLIGGHDAPDGRYPYFGTVEHYGGGVLIAPDILLTAGHVKPPLDQHVKARFSHDHYQSNNYRAEPDDEETFEIIRIERHPGYNTSSWDMQINDFSLFQIDGFSKVKPVKLNRDPHVPTADTKVTVIGFGSTKADPATFVETTPLTLQELTLRIVGHDDCEASYDPKRPEAAYKGRIWDDQMICTSGGPHNEKDACAFDSGSPLLLTPKVNGVKHDVVTGLVSWGEECADPYFPAVNARVSYAMDWIDQVVCEISKADPSELQHFNCSGKTFSTNSSSGSLGDTTTTTTSPTSGGSLWDRISDWWNQKKESQPTTTTTTMAMMGTDTEPMATSHHHYPGGFLALACLGLVVLVAARARQERSSHAQTTTSYHDDEAKPLHNSDMTMYGDATAHPPSYDTL